MLLNIVYVLVGIILLIIGADSLVRGSSGLALRLGVSGLVVGLTVVAFGTSTPELVVSLSATLKGNEEIALGNVVGSNIANIALILGLSALISPIRTSALLIRRDIPVMIAISIVLSLFMINGYLGRLEGLFLLTALIGYLIVAVSQSKAERDKEVREQFKQAVPLRPQNPVWLLILVIVGLGLLVLGANLFVQGAVGIARWFSVSDAIIGLTLVAVGTSLPELATSVVASIRQNNDIAVGNVVGSNFLNILCILGLTVTISPSTVQGITVIDMGVLLLTTLLLLPMVRSRFVLNRWEGGLLLIIYIGYMVSLFR
ncbi:MAG: calcium/sodium antiporter [Fidelibacterota bacterium]|nr:MAG: calcium/sodium antiporter [Candidatus Neomarinimicrobiota bacterium]